MTVVQGRKSVNLRIAGRVLALEAELGCELARDLPPRAKPYSRAEVAAAVRKVVPLLEINAPSFRRPLEIGGLCLIADNGVNAGAVLGAPGAVRLDVIAHARVTLRVNGRGQAEGQAASCPDDPLSALCWLANQLRGEAGGLLAGQVIATGAMAPPVEVTSECMVEADFAALGALQVTFVE